MNTSNYCKTGNISVQVNFGIMDSALIDIVFKATSSHVQTYNYVTEMGEDIMLRLYNNTQYTVEIAAPSLYGLLIVRIL